MTYKHYFFFIQTIVYYSSISFDKNHCMSRGGYLSKLQLFWQGQTLVQLVASHGENAGGTEECWAQIRKKKKKIRETAPKKLECTISLNGWN